MRANDGFALALAPSSVFNS